MSGFSKRGPALVHDKASHGWDACWLEVTDTAISCYDAEGGKPIRCVAISDEFVEHQVRALPDYARRSRHSGKFPFHILHPEVAPEIPYGGLAGDSDGLLVAVECGPALWDWLCAVRWRGHLPVPVTPPSLRCMVTSDEHELYQDPLALQNKLLEVMSYKDYKLPAVAEPPPDADADKDAATPEAHGSDGSDGSDESDSSDSDDDDYQRRYQHDDNGSGRVLTEARLDAIIQSMPYFMRTCLVGASIHAAEQNFEMVLSTELVDLPNLPKGGNMPLSMCMEGDPSPSRSYIATTLVKRGCPIGPEVRAGCASDSTFTFFLTKPSRIGGMTSVTGAPVTEDDKQLVKFLIDHGDGAEFNAELAQAMQAAADTPLLEAATEDELRRRIHHLKTVGASTADVKAAVQALSQLRAKGAGVADAVAATRATRQGGAVTVVAAPAANADKDAATPEAHGSDGSDGSNSSDSSDSDDDDYQRRSAVDAAAPGNHKTTFKYSGSGGSWWGACRGATILAFPEALAAWCRGLVQLDLSNNTLTTLPEALFDLVNLEELDLAKNCIWTLSPRVRNLTKLKSLDVAHNCLESLPDELALMPALESLACDRNPIINPPQSVVRRGLAEIKKFFQDGYTHGMRPNTDLKVLVLGLSEAGKTSLINGLTEATARLMRRGDRTVGIETRTHSFPRPDKPEVNLLIHDFAGQQEYYASHHVFLSERALYIIAFDLSKYSKASYMRQIDFWWSAIQDRVPGAEAKTRVMVVGTHADMLDPATAQRRCEHAQTTMSNKKRNTVKELKRKVKAANKELKRYGQARDGFAEAKLAELGIAPELLKSARAVLAATGKGALSEAEADVLDTFAELRVAKGETGQALAPEHEAHEASLHGLIGRWNAQQELLLDIPDKVYPVSSADGLAGMQAFRDGMVDAVQDRASFPQLDENIPTTYFSVRKMIRAKRLDPAHQFMETTEFLATMAAELTNGDGERLTESEVERATLFMHDLGEVFYDKKAAPDVVFLKVGYLIDAMKFIIRHDHGEATSYAAERHRHVVGDPAGVEMTAAQFYAAKADLLGAGKLDMALLRRLWALPAPEGLGLPGVGPKFDSMVRLMERFEIAAWVDSDTMVVPEFLAEDLPVGVWPTACPAAQIGLQRWFQFVKEPPRGIMARLQVRLCSRLDRFSFSKRGLVARLGGCDVRCEMAKGDAQTPLLTKGLRLQVRGAPSAVWAVINLLQAAVDELLESWPGLRYDSMVVAPSTAGNAGNVHLLLQQLILQRRAGATTVAVPAAECEDDGTPDGIATIVELDVLLGPAKPATDAAETNAITTNPTLDPSAASTAAMSAMTVVSATPGTSTARWHIGGCCTEDPTVDVLDTREPTRVRSRRLSCGETNLDGDLLDNTAAAAVDVFQAELQFDQGVAATYVSGLTKAFGTGADADDLLSLSDNDLAVVVTDVQHRRRILQWIEQRAALGV